MSNKPETMHDFRSRGGKAAAAALTDKQRSERARHGARVRWERFREARWSTDLAEINRELDADHRFTDADTREAAK